MVPYLIKLHNERAVNKAIESLRFQHNQPLWRNRRSSRVAVHHLERRVHLFQDRVGKRFDRAEGMVSSDTLCSSLFYNLIPLLRSFSATC